MGPFYKKCIGGQAKYPPNAVSRHKSALLYIAFKDPQRWASMIQ